MLQVACIEFGSECQFYTFDADNFICLMFSDCNSFTDEFCSNCLSGEPTCILEDSEPQSTTSTTTTSTTTTSTTTTTPSTTATSQFPEIEDKKWKSLNSQNIQFQMLFCLSWEAPLQQNLLQVQSLYLSILWVILCQTAPRQYLRLRLSLWHLPEQPWLTQVSLDYILVPFNSIIIL